MRATRIIGLALVMALGIGTVTAAVAGSFVDVPSSNIFESDIDWLAEQGITKGCNPPVNDRFCPSDYVTRGQMAAFLVRGLGLTDDGGGNGFVDDDGSVFEADIARLAAAGVTRGCNPPTNDRFCPSDYVTREQMAAFLSRALGGSSPLPPPTPPPAVDQPEAPITAAFMYPWFPNAWDQGGQIPYSQFTPAAGLYDSSAAATIDRQVSEATGSGLEAFIASWWGPGHHTDSATEAVLNRIPSSPNPNFRVAIYYEEEGQSDPSATAIKNDLDYLTSLFDKPSYLRVDGKPVVFVWAESSDGAGMAARWADAKDLYGGDVHIVLKLFSGYESVADQPDSWHQYGPANNYSEHLPHSATVSPGFWHADESSARLARDPARFRSDVQAMVDSGAFWQLITTWNEWGEGTSVEPADEFGTTYLDILDDEIPRDVPPTSPPPGAGVVFAAGGDFGATSATDATFGSMGESGAEFLLALGDLSYDDATAEEWCGYVKGFLGDVFPVELVVGNHEDDDRVDGFIGDFAACLPDRMGSSGVYAAEYFFDVDGLARFIMIGAGNDVDGVKYDYEVGNSHYQWLEDTIDGARSEGIPWVIVGMHKPCVTAGNKSCEVGAEVYDLLLDKRVDLILHGHDHDYQRSKQLVCVTPEVYRSECVVDSGADGVYSRGAGSVFIINGNTGGGGLTDIDTGDPEIGYLAEWHGANSADPGRGYTLFTLTSDELQVQFVGTTTSYTDTFTIN